MEIIQSFVFGVLFFKFFLVVLFEKQNIYMVVILIGIQMIWQIIYAYYSEWYVKIFTESSNAGIQESMYTILFNKMVTVDMGTLESPEYYDTFRMVMQNSTGAIIAITNNIFSYIKNIILLVLNGCLLFSYEPMLFVFIILSVACSYCSNILKNKYQVEKNRTVNPLLRKYEYVKRIFYSAEYAADIKCTDVYEVLIKSANITNDDIRKKQEEINKKLLVISSLSAILSVILRQISNIWLGANALLTKRFTSGDIAVAISSMVNMRNTLNTFLNLYPQIQESKIYVADYMHYIETESDIKENEKGDLPKRGANSIQIKNVSFSYDGQKEILKDINMEIREGEKIAIIGKNGAGKSTLVKLLLQLYKPQSGQIAMDQKPAETYILKAYRERFGVAWLFSNYINFYVNTNHSMPIDYLCNVHKDWTLHTNNYFLDFITETEDEINSLGFSLLEYIKKMINLNRYIEILVNDNLHLGRTDSNGAHFHQNLIYGYDDELQQFHLLYYKNGIIKSTAMTYKDFLSERNYIADRKIYIIKYNPGYEAFKLDPKHVLQLLQEYRDSSNISHYESLYTSQYHFGMSGLQYLIEHDTDSILIKDVRIGYMIYEHSICTRDRIEYFFYKNILSGDEYVQLYNMALEECELTSITKNLIIKQHLQKNYDTIKVRAKIIEILEMEKNLINQMLEILCKL